MFKGGLHCPVVLCDSCREVIGDFSEGTAVFLDGTRQRELSKTPVMHAHTFKCVERVTKVMRGYDTQPLGGHLYWLLSNSEVNVATFKQLKQKYAGA